MRIIKDFFKEKFKIIDSASELSESKSNENEIKHF